MKHIWRNHFINNLPSVFILCLKAFSANIYKIVGLSYYSKTGHDVSNILSNIKSIKCIKIISHLPFSNIHVANESL